MASSSLKRGDARIYAQRYIISGIRQDMTGQQILEMLRNVQVGNTTLGYRTQVFYQDYNRYLNAKTPPTLRGTKSLPDDWSVSYTLNLPSSGRPSYVYPFVLSGFNQDTGEPVEQNVAISSPYKLDNTLVDAAFNAVDWQTQYNMSFNMDDVTPLPPQRYDPQF